jgi:hypothetical protein
MSDLMRIVLVTPDELRELVREVVEAVLLDRDDLPAHEAVNGLLDRSGAARWLKISLAKLDALCRREDDPLPYALCGDSRRFEREEIRAWVRRQRAQ